MNFSLSTAPLFPSGRPTAYELYGHRKGFVGVLYLVGESKTCVEASSAQRKSAKALDALDQLEDYLREKDLSLFQQYYEAAPSLGQHLIQLKDSLKQVRSACEDHSLFQSVTEATSTADFLSRLSRLAKVQGDLAPIRAVREDIQAVIQAIDKQLPSQDQDSWIRRCISALSVLGIFLSYLGVPNTFFIPLSIIMGGEVREERNDGLRQQKQACKAFIQTLKNLQQHSPTQENNMEGLKSTEKLAQITVQGFADLRNLIIERTGGSAPAQSASEKTTETQPAPQTEAQPKTSENPTHKASGNQTLPDIV